MKANVSKTKVMWLGTLVTIREINHVNVVVNDCNVEKVNSFKYLGVNIVANLKKE